MDQHAIDSFRNGSIGSNRSRHIENEKLYMNKSRDMMDHNRYYNEIAGLSTAIPPIPLSVPQRHGNANTGIGKYPTNQNRQLNQTDYNGLGDVRLFGMSGANGQKHIMQQF